VNIEKLKTIPLLNFSSRWNKKILLREIAQLIGLHFTMVKVVHYFSQEIDWDTFWVTSQTHLTTLMHRNLDIERAC
jgi:hypothetical protein